MSVLSPSGCCLLSAICAFTLLAASGCGTEAQGVDACRDIEQARCSAAKSCGLIEDVDACKRFYRDQCLHGLSVKSPGSLQVGDCVATIRAAGLCAAQDQGSKLSECDPPLGSAAADEPVCHLIDAPETASACSFLAPGEDQGSAGSGAVDESGGAAGDGGSSGSAN